MLGYRVFPSIRGVRSTQPGHALHVGRQGAGRWDNPELYVARYLATDPTTAVIETFAGLAWWTATMFAAPALPSGAYRLAAIRLPDDLRIADLDDPAMLVALGERPTGVMSADRRHTQELAARIHAAGKHDGIGWWSTWPEHRALLAVWRGDAKVDHVEDLDLDHEAVIAAAGVLAKPIRSGRGA